MLLLSETSAGYGLFRLTDKKILKMDADQVAEAFQDSDKAQKALSLVAFSMFKDTKDAMEEATALLEAKMGKKLKKFLKTNIVVPELSEKLAVIDSKLGATINKKFAIECVHTETVRELMRGLRHHMQELVEGMDEKAVNQMSLGLAHTMSRFKLKFSPDKVDTMIIQAVGLLDDLDKELNNFAMRLREWYGWHFPELAKIVGDNMVYAKVVKVMGMRSNCKNTDFAELGLPDEVVAELRKGAEVSFGTDITEEDLEHILILCERVIELMKYRAELANYLKLRMTTIAPNLTYMVGELIGARLISHAGSLMNLAKHPASTVQILGAEKSLFRALKNKSATPKYGLLYHAGLVGQSAPKLKGKISRVLAAKLSLCIRVDALGDDQDAKVGKEWKEVVEKRLTSLEDGSGGIKRGMAKADQKAFKAKENVEKHNEDDDAPIAAEPKKKKPKQEEPMKKVKGEEVKDEEAEDEAPKEKKKKKKNKEAQEEAAETEGESSPKKKRKEVAAEDEEEPPKKKKKKNKEPKEEEE